MLRKFSTQSFVCAALVVALAMLFFFPQFQSVRAQSITLPYGFVEDVVVDGLWLPSSFAFAPDGRIFITEKAGVVRVWQDGQLLPEPFIDMQNEVNSSLDRGMLGIAVHPQFPSQPYVYVSYVYDPPETKGMEPTGARVARVVRLEADAGNTNRARAGGTKVLLGNNSRFATIGNPQQGETRPFSCMREGDVPLNDCLPAEGIHHTVGGMVFGPNGLLYVANGDGINSIFGNIRAQNLDSLAGKILRIDPLTGDGLPSNPFFDGNPSSNRSKVYLLGMRNPFRFNIHPQTGELYVGDVGNDNWEEINIGRAGANFGWPCFEGLDQITTNPACDPLLNGSAVHTTGTYIYPHINNQGSVIGGDFYRSSIFPPRYHGRFFFGEFNEGTIMFLDPAVGGKSPSRRFAGNMDGPVQIVSAPDGALYVLLIKPGRLSRIRFSIQEYGHREAGNPPSPVTILPASGAPLLPVYTAPAAAPAAPPPTAIAPITAPPPTTAGSDQPITSQPATAPALSDAISSVTIKPARQRDANSPIYVSVLEPANGAMVKIGDTVRYRGWATDAAGQEIASDNLSWTVFLHHDEHMHFDYHNGKGTTGSFLFVDHGDRSYLEICLTASVNVEGSAVSNTDCANIRAQEVTYVFDTVPSGQPLIYNSGRYVTPFRVVTYVNAERQISAPIEPQPGYAFAAWSNGGEVRQTLKIGQSNQTLSAAYAVPRAEQAAVPTAVPTISPTAFPTAFPTLIPTAPAAVAASDSAPVAVQALVVEPTAVPAVTIQPMDDQYPLDAFRVIHPGPTHTDSGRAYFRWETSIIPPADQAFEIVFWKPGQDAMADGFGMNAPTTRNDFRIDLETLDKALGDLLLPGTYKWTVLLVNTSPYERIQVVSDTREFTFERK